MVMSFNGVYEDFIKEIAVSGDNDKRFFESTASFVKKLSSPLGEDQIETTYTRNGKRVVEVIQIGEKVAEFKNTIENEEAKLKLFWKQWDDLQNDFIQLGIEVFGAEAFNEGQEQSKTAMKGSRDAMELGNLEHKARVDKIFEEVEGITKETLRKMRIAEKVLGDLDLLALTIELTFSLELGRKRQERTGCDLTSGAWNLRFEILYAGTSNIYCKCTNTNVLLSD
jgi:phosphopantothenoylcysteine decarboxylase